VRYNVLKRAEELLH